MSVSIASTTYSSDRSAYLDSDSECSSPLSEPDKGQMSLLEQMPSVTIRFEVPLPECGVKATSFRLNQLYDYHAFSVSLANIMSIALKEVDVGYTLPWKKYSKKDIDIGNCVTTLDDTSAIRDLARNIEQFLTSEFNCKLAASKNSDVISLQMIADAYTIALHCFKQIHKNKCQQEGKSMVRNVFSIHSFDCHPMSKGKWPAIQSKRTSKVSGQ